MTEQYSEQLQKFTTVNIGLNLYPVSSQEEVGKILIQMVCDIKITDVQSHTQLFQGASQCLHVKRVLTF